MDAPFDRRTFVATAGLGAGALILGGTPVDAWARRRRRPPRIPLAVKGTFEHGVSSGDPAQDAVTLWTRLGQVGTSKNGDRRLFLDISRDPGFGSVDYSRTIACRSADDHTISIRVGGSRKGKKILAPGERYHYRFRTRQTVSDVGRFQTRRPEDSREPVRIAFFSCQDWQAGFYGAHRTLADIDDLDLVVCLGDYVYERNFYEGPRKDTLGANRDGEVQTLDEYRSKYRMYRGDADLRAMHAKHPFIGIWDDHEVEDNYAADRPGDETQQKRVEFPERRANGYRAYFEYMPFRPAAAPGNGVYRSIVLGQTAELILLDERQFRDDQPCGDAFFTPCAEAESAPRTFLGGAQKQWFKDRLESSAADWKLVANQLMIMSFDLVPGRAQVTKDSWDGYGQERREILEHVRSRSIDDVAFLTGDIHTFFAGDVGVDGRAKSPAESVATEFVGGSVTSLGVPETLEGATGAPLTREQFSALAQVKAANPHLRYDEQLSRGYGLLTAFPDRLEVEFKGVDAKQRTDQARTLQRFRVDRGAPRVQLV